MPRLEGVSRAIGQRRLPQIIYYFRVNGRVFLGELNPNASRPDTLGPFWRHPYHSAFYVKRRGFIQQREQQLYLVSQFMPLCVRNEQPAITKEGHVGVVQRRQVFDHDLENVSTRPVSHVISSNRLVHPAKISQKSTAGPVEALMAAVPVQPVYLCNKNILSRRGTLLDSPVELS